MKPSVGGIVVTLEILLLISSCVLMVIFKDVTWLAFVMVALLFSIPITCFSVDGIRTQKAINVANKKWLETHDITGKTRQSCIKCKHCVIKTFYNYPYRSPYPYYCKKLKKRMRPDLTTICCADLYADVEWRPG